MEIKVASVEGAGVPFAPSLPVFSAALMPWRPNVRAQHGVIRLEAE